MVLGRKGGSHRADLVATIIVFFYVPNVSFPPCLRGGFRLFFSSGLSYRVYLAVCMACPFVSPHFMADQSLRGVS